MTKYTIAACNYNMSDTLRRSLNSMLKQITDEFEILVVDGGSTDGSERVLRQMAQKNSSLRVILLGEAGTGSLGGDRNVSFKNSIGEFVLESLDLDDYYYEQSIVDFVEIYTQIREQISTDFYLSGDGINIAPRNLLLEYPYKCVSGAEDRDLWRRLSTNNKIIYFDHNQVHDQIGYYKSLRQLIRRDLNSKICDFQSGISFKSCLSWALSTDRPEYFSDKKPFVLSVLKRIYDLTSFPYAYLVYLFSDKYQTDHNYEKKGAIECEIESSLLTLTEIERSYDITINRSRLSSKGLEYYDKQADSS